MATDHLSITFAALADPTRRAILARLAQGEASVTELAKPFDLSLPGISKHLKEASEWVGEYQRFWDERFQRLDDVLQDLIKEETTSNDHQGRQDDAQD